MAVRRLSRSWPQKPSAAIFLHCSCLPRVISQAAVTRRNRRSCLLLRFRQPKFVQFASGRLHLAARLDDARLVDQCTHFCRRPRSGGAVPRPTDRLLGTAGAELAVKLAASLVRIRFVPVHGFSPTYCVQQHFPRGPGLRFNAESASNNSASLAPREINSFNAFTVSFIC
jgi:hypothetical protein